VFFSRAQENVSRFFQSWVEDTKKMDLAKVRDGYPGEAWTIFSHLDGFPKKGVTFFGAKKGSSHHQHIPTTWAWLNVATFIDIWMSVDL